MHKYLPIILLLQSCMEIETVQMPLQVNPYVCSDGWQYTLQGEPIIDEFGNQLMCVVT